MIANGEDAKSSPPPWFLSEQPFVAVADGGYRLAQKWGLPVHLAVGDFDSIEPQEYRQLQQQNPLLYPYPCDKDYSDLELTLKHLQEQGFSQVILVNVLGGRWDHTLFNLVSILELCQEMGLNAWIWSPHNQIALTCGHNQIHNQQSSLCSLLSLDSITHEIDLEGFLYPLAGEPLSRTQTRGLSNVILKETATIRHQKGKLLVVLTPTKEKKV